MRNLGKYLSWFLFGLAVLGGIGTIVNFFSGEEKKVEETLKDDSFEAESFAKVFAHDYLTINQGETKDERTKRLAPYLDLSELKWQPPELNQVPRTIEVRNSKFFEKDQLTIVTLDVVVDLAPNSGTAIPDFVEVEGDVNKTEGEEETSDKDATEEEQEDKKTQSKGSLKIKVTSKGENEKVYDYSGMRKRFLLEVPIQHEGNRLSIRSEPVMEQMPDIERYVNKPKERMADGEVVKQSEQFITNFVQSFFSGVSIIDVQPYLGKDVTIQPLDNYEHLKKVDKVSVYYRGQDKEKEPNERYFYSIVRLTTQDPDTKIVYSQQMRVYFTEDVANQKLFVTYILRN